MNPISLSRASSAASADPLPFSPGSYATAASTATTKTGTSSSPHHTRSHSTGTSNSSSLNQHQSTFKQCLKPIPVPAPLQQGIPVVRVYANGKTQKQYLTLSHDKFTLYVSTQPLYGGGNSSNNRNNKRGGKGWLFLRRSSSVDSQHNITAVNAATATAGTAADTTTASTTTNGNNANNSTTVSTTSSSYYYNIHNRFNNNNQSNKVRAIDIGAIHRIQRGNANRRFEMLKKHKQDSLKNLLLNNNTNHSTTDDDNNNNTNTANDVTTLNPGLCFSVIFRGDWTIDLMIIENDTSITRDQVLDALDRVIQAYQYAKRNVSNEVMLLRYVWLDADKDKSNTIKPNELGGVLDRINFQMKKSELNGLYENFARVIGLKGRDRKHGLTFEQTCTLLHKIKRDSWVVKPVNQYWNKLFGEFMNNGKPRMTVSDKTFLEKFLHAKQGETKATIQDVQQLFARLNQLELPYVAGEGLPKDPRRIDKNRFEAYLLGPDNDAFDPLRETFNPQCMKRPISEFWINSSHNTYLTGDQLTSNSSIDMYSNALYRGCKCLELDVWDGSITAEDGPVPVVYHGHTMTSKILFKDIIKAIKLFLSFHPDTFPLILSFENHCSLPYQEVMAEQLVRILGNSFLYIPKEESLLGRLPSPWDLRGMVVIKGRRPADLDIDDYDDDNSDDGAPSTIFSGELTHKSSDITTSQHKTEQYRVHPALARLTLFHGTKLRGWDISVMNPTHYMHSFSENKVRSLCRKTDRRKWTIYNQSHMSRAYPAGSRVDSSNYLPMLPWSVGTQMVALNFQTIDAALLLNDGRFRENGGCGYVLKPTSLMDLQEPSSGSKPLKLSIRVLSGSCLPKPNEARTGDCIDPYVKVSVYDVQNGIKDTFTTYSTNVVTANGFFPIWNSEKFTFIVENYAVAMLQLSVFDKKKTINATSNDDFVASASIPISCLRKGLRSVKLFDTSNTRSGAFDFSSLLIDVKKERSEVTNGVYGGISPVHENSTIENKIETLPRLAEF